MADISVDAQREHLRSWLERHGVRGAAVRETHVSFLAFTEARVWKCKKAVRFPFIDLSTAEKRRVNCEREVALNRRLTADVYLGVVPLEDADGAVVDHLVEMRRLPDQLRLSAAIGREAGAHCVDEIADALVRFHAHAATGGAVDRAASPAALEELWARSIDELEPFAGRVLDRATCERVAGDARRYLSGRTELLEDRIVSGCVRDGHGDLLADDVFCLPDGPRILDCLEFDDRLRFGDVLADVAFLAMDLERLGRRDLARRLLDRYAERAGDQWPPSLEHFYVAYRALVRAKVACLRVGEDADAASAAQALLSMTARHLAAGRVRLVLIGGPPATGKSTLARALGRLTGWPVLHSDEVRKALAGIAPTTSARSALDRGLYTDSWTDRTYGVLEDRARYELERGRSVVVDASWSADERRERAVRLAHQTASELTSFVCTVDPAVADARAAERERARTDASDASPLIAAELRTRFAPWPAAIDVDTSEAPDAVARRVLTRLGVDVTWA